MNCNEGHLLIHAYADGELDLARSLDVERHVKTCAACAAATRSVQSLRAALRQSDLAYRAPEALRNHVRQAIGAASAQAEPRNWAQLDTPTDPLSPPERGEGWGEGNLARKQGTSSPRPSPPFGEEREKMAAVLGSAPRNYGQSFWQWLALGATAFAALTLLLRPSGMSEGEQIANEAVASHVRSLMAEHLTDVASSDQHTVKPWFNGKLDFAPDVKDFAAQGFPMVGGRLDYLDGRAVAALVYRRNKHFINVFVWPPKNAGASITEHLRGYSVIHRDANGLHYCLVSDLNEKELAEFAGLMAK